MPPKLKKGKKAPKADPAQDDDATMLVDKHPHPSIHKKVTYPRRHLPSIARRSSSSNSSNSSIDRANVAGFVRATPPGHNLQNDDTADKARYDRWTSYRLHPSRAYIHPKEGFRHIYGEADIRSVDAVPVGGRVEALDGPYHHDDDDAAMDRDEEEALHAELLQRRALLHGTDGTFDKDGREYGASRTPLDAPIGSLRDKWRVLPHFLRLRGLMRQHIDSYDHFVNVELRQIVRSPSACEVRSDYDPKFYLRYTDCWVGEPSVDEDSYSTTVATPFRCRLRDCTYSAPIYVNVRYTRGRQIVVKKKVAIGRMPVMLRSSKCLLRGRSEDELARMKECPVR